jgi:small subunit ribosomal protein S4e
MSGYLKIQRMGKFWPVPRKGKAYVASATHNNQSSIPLIVVMRDILKLLKTKKELKKIINEKQVQINGKETREVSYPVGLFDVISLKNMNKNYRATFNETKKMIFEEISDKESNKKTLKILGKKILGKNSIQLQLMDGMNILTKENVKVGNSVIYNFKDKKIEKIIKMEKGVIGFVTKGKHMGHAGKIEEVVERGGKFIAKIKTKDEKINVWIKNLIAMEK